MKKKRLLILLVAALTAACLLLVSCAQKDGDELTHVTVSEVTHSVFYAPQYAAIALGYFEEEGIELELINGGGADKVMTALLSGQVDIGFSGPEACIYVYNEGGADHPMVFAQLTKRDGSFIVGREADADFALESIKGSHILGGRAGGVPYMTLEYVLGQHGVDPDNTNIDTSVAFDAMAGAFTGGTGDYVTLFEPTASLLEAEGKGYVLASVGEESGEIPYTAYYSTQSYLKDNRDTVESFTRAIYRAQKWIAETEPAEIAATIASFFPDTSEELLTSVAARYKAIDAWNADPLMKEAALERLQDVMEAAGELETRVPYEKMVNTEFAETVMK